MILNSCIFTCDSNCMKYIENIQKQNPSNNIKILLNPSDSELSFLNGYKINKHGPFPSCVYIDEKTKKKKLISGFDSINKLCFTF